MIAILAGVVLNFEVLKPGECRVLVMPVELYGEVRPVAFKCCRDRSVVCRLVIKES